MSRKTTGNGAFLEEDEKIDENTFQIMFGTDVHLGHQGSDFIIQIYK